MGLISFENDYSEGAHPEILKRLTDTKFTKLIIYNGLFKTTYTRVERKDLA